MKANAERKNECLWCGKKITSFCNSHSVPQCVLKNIEVNGKFDYFNTLAELPVMNLDKGLNEAGTFKLLCRDSRKKYDVKLVRFFTWDDL